jgi:type VI secretion system secreted protein VgrG
MQHNESDAAFLRRLWKRQGIGSFIRPGQSGTSIDSATPSHTLVLFDTPQSLAQNAAGAVRFQSDYTPQEAQRILLTVPASP